MANIKDLKDAKPALAGYGREVRDRVEETKDDLEDIANKAGRKVRGVFSKSSQEITEAADSCTTAIRSNPVQASLIALGAGFLLGSLFRR